MFRKELGCGDECPLQWRRHHILKVDLVELLAQRLALSISFLANATVDVVRAELNYTILLVFE